MKSISFITAPLTIGIVVGESVDKYGRPPKSLTLSADMEPLGRYRVGLRSSFLHVSMIGVMLRSILV